MLKKIKNNKWLIFFSIFESFLQIYSRNLVLDKSLSEFSILNILEVLILGLFLSLVNYIYIIILDKKYNKVDKHQFSKKNFIIRWILIFLMWLPVLLAFYPSIWAYDVFNHVPHFINRDVFMIQPLFYTMVIEFFIFIGKIIINYNFGILLNTLFQMIVMSCIFSYVVEKIQEKIENQKFRIAIEIILIIYYGLVIFNSILAVSITKDVLFSGLILLLIIYLYDFIDDKKLHVIKLILIFSGLLLIKNNFLYVFILLSITYIIYFKNKRKNLLKIFISSFLIYFTVNNTLIWILKPIPIAADEAYSIPIQNLIYTVGKHKNIDVSDNEYLFEFIPRDAFSENIFDEFDKYSVDHVKSIINKYDFSRYKLMKYWFKYGLKYPIDYIDSYSMLMSSTWYLFDEGHTKEYPDNGGSYLMTYFYEMEGLDGVKSQSLLPNLRRFIEKFTTENIQYNKLSILRFIFCPATYILSFFLIICYLLKKHMIKELMPLLTLVILYTSILTGPSIIIRYIYPYMISLPIIFIRIIIKNNENMIK